MAQERTERTSAMESNWDASLGINPCGNKTPLYSVGLNCAVGMPLAGFRSKVSVWLGAPCIITKIQFLAVAFGLAAA